MKSAGKGGRASIRLGSTQAILRRAQEIKRKKRHILVDTEGMLLHRNRQVFRPSQGFRRSAKALDRRTNDPPGFNPGVNRCRRLAKDWENLNVNALAFLRFASIRLMLRKLRHPS